MVGTHTISPHYNLQLSVGIQGKVQSLPSGFVHRTILVPTPPNESGGESEGEGGITAAIDEWGQVLRQMYGKAPADVAALNQPTTSYLGYWTDNGAYYYYTTEPGLSYEKTMIDIAKVAKKNALPFKHYQFDSWWYYKDQNGGLLLWEPRYDIFPSGMASLNEAMDFPPLVLHNRFFSAFNAYEDMGFKFIIEEENDISLPVDQKMFEYLMGTARLWGMSVYEQDWIIKTFSEMNATQNNIYNARHWLLAMGRAAATTGVTIQYCMTLPNAFLQSVEIPTVVQVRASHDYQPGNDNWKVTYTSMFLDALGLIPFKDNFWTTSKPQPGCKWPSTGCIEPNPELHALSAVLATGPVGPSDGIGYTNRSRIMKTCREDGLILKPDKPAKPLDTVFTAQFNTTAFSFVSQPINPLQVWVTSSRHQLRNNHNQHSFKWTVIDDEENEEGCAKWIYILAAGLPYQFNITPVDLGLSDHGAKLYDFAQMEVADDDNFVNAVHDFDAKHPLIIPSLPSFAPIMQHRYYVVCPVLETSSWRWTFVGETNKFVPASKQRVRSISLFSHPKSGKEGIRVSVDGVPDEEVITLRFIAERKESASSSFPLTIRCTVGSPAFIQVECTSLKEGTPSCTCSPSASSSSSLSSRSRKSAAKDGPRTKKKMV
ncbi:Ricin B-type lectin domain-containing protein, variant 2 [Balamuthia mandrillaris]